MTAEKPEAWAFIVAHESLLTRYAYSRRFRPSFADIGDYHHDLLLAVLDAFEKFNPRDSASRCKHCGGRGCSTWLGWQARAVATTHGRAHARRVDEEPVADRLDLVSTYGAPRAIEQRARIAEVLQRATPDERAAAMTVLRGLDEQGVKDAIGVTRPARDFRLRKLAQRFKENPHGKEAIGHTDCRV